MCEFEVQMVFVANRLSVFSRLATPFLFLFFRLNCEEMLVDNGKLELFVGRRNPVT